MKWSVLAVAAVSMSACNGKIAMPPHNSSGGGSTSAGGGGGGSGSTGGGSSGAGGGSSSSGGGSAAGGGSGATGGGSASGGGSAAGGGSGATGGGSGATGGGAGTGGGGSFVFTADSPAVYGSKVKNVLTGLALTDAELTTLTNDPTQLGTLVDAWMLLPQYDQKMLRFFELAFQQTQISMSDFGNQLDPGQLQISNTTMLQNLEESFARTAVAMNDNNVPFNNSMSTSTYQMTTATQVFYALLDVWQIDDTQNGLHDAFKTANPNLTLTITGSGPIPLSQTLDPNSANYMHWYDPKIATVCGADPHTMPAKGNNMYYLLIGRYTGCNGGGGNGTPQLTAADFADWKPVTIRQPHTGETPTAFYDLPTLRDPNQTELVLNRPYAGFFSTPAFAANWQTNASNQMRVTINQTLIVATGTQVDGTDPTVPTSTPGLDQAHAGSSACLFCHQTLDPTRSILAATFSWNYGTQLDTTYSAQKGLFAYRGVQANVSSVYDLGTTLASHPLFAPGWVEKLCYYVNSEACDPSDSEFQTIVSNFNTGYSWRAMVKDLVTSPVTTHTVSTTTAVNNGEAVAVTRRDHLCAQWNARLGFADICGLDVTQTTPLANSAKQIIGGLPSDGYSRGSTAPVLPNDPSLFYRAGIENLCGALAVILIDNNSPPPGALTWKSSSPTTAISDFVTLVAGLPASDPRSAQLNTALTDHFNTAKAQSGITATSALQSTFMAACMSPSASSIGM